jgi:ankyrin repeat protein
MVKAAVLHGHLSVVKALHKGGWTVEPPCEETSLLRGVIEANRYEMLHYLLELGWDVSQPIHKPHRKINFKRTRTREIEAILREYTTLLHDACLNASVEIVARLVWAGADLGTKDSRGVTALDSALQSALQGASHDQLKLAFLIHIQNLGPSRCSDRVLNKKLKRAVEYAEKHPVS